MPKTSIYANTYPGDTAQRIRCEIGWAKGYDVQISVAQLAEGFEPTDEFVTRDEEALTITVGGQLVAPAGTTTTSSGFVSGMLRPAWDGPRMVLDREQINLMIRTLREARDAAYGRNE